MTLHAYADAAAKATSEPEALSICSESPLRRLSLLPNSPATSSAVSPWKLLSTPTERDMMWDDAFPQPQCADGEQEQPDGEESHLNFDFFSLVSKPKDYYKILEVGYDATDDAIRSNYIRLALKWHPDKQKNQDDATSRFQEINEAYQVLSDPIRRMEYDQNGMQHVYDYNLIEYLNRYKGLILTCNGLGIQHSIW